MKRWYFVIAAATALLCPDLAFCQQTGNFSGSSLTGGSATGSAAGQAGQTGTNIGQFNTTMLGSIVDVGFVTVFGQNATIANTNPDPFSLYRPTDSGTATGSNNFGMSNGNFGATGGQTGRGAAMAGNTTFGGMGVTGGNAGSNRAGGGVAGNRVGTANLGGGITGNRFGVTGGGALGGNRAFGNQLAGNRNTFGGMNFLGGMNFMGGAGNFLGGGTTQNTTPTMGYVVNWSPPAGTAASPPPSATGAVTVNNEVRLKLANAPALQGVQNLQVLTVGDIAVLRGTAPSESAKSLAAAMALLEPGIYRVDNQLVVAGTAPPPIPNP